MSRQAIIDMGTNTFHLLVVDLKDGQSTEVHREKKAVLLGKGGLSDGNLLPEALDRGLTALKNFGKSISKLNVDKVHAIATSAVRSGKNITHWLLEIKATTGIQVEIISGDREAGLIWKGVRKSMPLIGKWLIVDIGGGSTEFIIADSQQMFWKQSFPLGVSRLLDAFALEDPMHFDTELELHDHLVEELEPLANAMRKHKVVQLVGSSGSFDSLRDIMLAHDDITRDDALPNSIELPFNIYRHYSAQLRSMTEKERLQVAGLVPLRAKMIHVSCVIINTLMALVDFERLHQSDFALKEGKIAELLEEKLMN